MNGPVIKRPVTKRKAAGPVTSWENVVAHVDLGGCAAASFRRAVEHLSPDAIVEVVPASAPHTVSLTVTVPLDSVARSQLREIISAAVDRTGATWALARLQVEYRWLRFDDRGATPATRSRPRTITRRRGRGRATERDESDHLR